MTDVTPTCQAQRTDSVDHVIARTLTTRRI